MNCEKLAVVMPVYNEQDAIVPVLKKWCSALDALGVDYRIHPYNDGSKDESLSRMLEFAATDPRVIVHDKANSGHGPTILLGYRELCRTNDWIFQIDSDDEMGPEKFSELWEKRENYDFLLGIREGRKQPLPRKVISFVSRLVVKIFYGRKTVWDVNSPYRLMRCSVFADIFNNIPADTFAPNVIISGMVAKRKIAYYQQLIPQKDRQTGEVSIKKWKLFKAAVKSFAQTIKFVFHI